MRGRQVGPLGRADSDVRDLAIAGTNHCIIQTSGALLCAGLNLFGEIGDGTITPNYTPTAVGAFLDCQSITAGETHFCAIRGAGDLYCWGRNDYGQLGDGTAYSTAPVRVMD